MSVITVSSEFGAGGPAIGKQLAERLGLDYLDQELVHEIALGLDVSDEKVNEFDEAHHSRFRGFLSTVFDFDALRKSAKVAQQEDAPSSYDDREEIPYEFSVKGWIDRDIYEQMVVRVITAVAKRGGAVIKGRGSQWILKDHPNTLHLRFVGDVADRIARTMKRRGLSRKEARKLVDDMDKRGADFVRAHFDRDLTDSTLYHLVLNTSRIPPERCLTLLEDVARGLLTIPEEK
jgi:cytidylate kinase